MKTRLLILVLLIVCFACGTNKKPVSDAQKDKIIGELKEVINTIIKGAEEANPDIVLESYLDSPDFVFLYNGKTFTYKEIANDMKTDYSTQINQKCTIADEKFVVLDNTTVLYTTNCKWIFNFKDGHSTLLDPLVVQLLFIKVDGKWKVINCVESGVAQSVMNTETLKELNQAELMKQFIGTWKSIEKDTTFIWECKSFGNALEFTIKTETKSRVTTDAKSLLGYDKEHDRLIEAFIDPKSPEIYLCPCWFTSRNSFIQILWKDIADPDKADFKWAIEFINPDSFVITEIRYNIKGEPHTYLKTK
jgi:hypothetical protein